MTKRKKTQYCKNKKKKTPAQVERESENRNYLTTFYRASLPDTRFRALKREGYIGGFRFGAGLGR